MLDGVLMSNSSHKYVGTSRLAMSDAERQANLERVQLMRRALAFGGIAKDAELAGLTETARQMRKAAEMCTERAISLRTDSWEGVVQGFLDYTDQLPLDLAPGERLN